MRRGGGSGKKKLRNTGEANGEVRVGESSGEKKVVGVGEENYGRGRFERLNYRLNRLRELFFRLAASTLTNFYFEFMFDCV